MVWRAGRTVGKQSDFFFGLLVLWATLESLFARMRQGRCWSNVFLGMDVFCLTNMLPISQPNLKSVCLF